MPRRSWKHTVRSYGLAVAQAPRLLSADGRGRWVLRVSFLAGMATGSVRDRTIYLSE